MKIQRDYLGGSEVIHLGTVVGLHDFIYHVVQDVDAADGLLRRIKDEVEVVVNETEPEFIERFTLL